MIIYRLNADDSSEKIETGFDTLELLRDFEGVYSTWDSVPVTSDEGLSFRLWVNDNGLSEGNPRNILASALLGALTDDVTQSLYGDVFVTAAEDSDGEVRTLDERHDGFLFTGLILLTMIGGSPALVESSR